MKKIPELVFVIDTNYESLAIAESAKLGIPIIAILDSNSNPDNIDYPIPGNDDARRAIDLYCNLIKETIINAKSSIPAAESKQEKTKRSRLLIFNFYFFVITKVIKKYLKAIDNHSHFYIIENDSHYR